MSEPMDELLHRSELQYLADHDGTMIWADKEVREYFIDLGMAEEIKSGERFGYCRWKITDKGREALARHDEQ